MDDPFSLFEIWLREASEAHIHNAEAMLLSTLGADLRLSSRTVLLKHFSPKGLTFYTNAHSRKAQALAVHRNVSLTFYWRDCGRQIHIEGEAHSVPSEEADAYFAQRPRESQIGAWASKQSSVLDSQATLEERVAVFKARFSGEPVPRPPHWIGFCVTPDRFEFWEEGDFRLHHRLMFENKQNLWSSSTLYP